MPRHKESERREIKRSTRNRLLEAAAEAFCRLGFERASVDDISNAAGFAKGTIYNYFASKRAILLTLLDDCAAGHNRFVKEAVQAATAPPERVERFLEAGFAWVSQNPTQARLLLNTLNGPDHELRQRLFQAYAPMFQLVNQDIVGAGVAEGRFRPLDPGPTSSLIMLFYLGVASQTAPQVQPLLSSALVSDLLLNGLLAHR